MDLELNSRLCGNVHIVECKGRIVAGAEGAALESTLRQDWCRCFNQVVLHMGQVHRLDSMGIGFIVRHSAALKQRGGDMRLSEVTPPISSLFQMTRLDSVIRIFPSEQDAILSFLTRAATDACTHCPAGTILLVDQSPDFGAFAQAVLARHGYDVKLATLVRDARILLTVNKPDCILAGPSTHPDALAATLATFRSLAPKAKVLALDPALKTSDPHHAAEALLRVLGSQPQAQA